MLAVTKSDKDDEAKGVLATPEADKKDEEKGLLPILDCVAPSGAPKGRTEEEVRGATNRMSAVLA